MKMLQMLAVLLIWAAAPGSAESMEAVTLEPIEHASAELVVTGPDGSEVRYTPQQIEEFPTYRLETTTPWRSEATVFEGVRLADILAANDLTGMNAVSVVAENEYAVSIPQSAWQELDIMVATRANGAPISRRERGPIQFVVDAEVYKDSPNAREDYLVWMAARIAPDQ